MTNSRKRMLDSFHFSQPDKIPVVYSPSIAGIYVHGQKLLDLFNAYPPDNPIVFDKIPLAEKCTIDENGSYYEVKKDEWGTEWEYMIFGVTGHPKNYPFNSWGETKEYNFPPLPSASSDLFRQDKMDIAIQRKDYLVFKGWVSIFEKLHALQPFEKLLMDLLMHDSYLIDFLDRMVDYWEKVDGKWCITVLKYQTSISGARKGIYMIPKDGRMWKNETFIQVDPELVKPKDS